MTELFQKAMFRQKDEETKKLLEKEAIRSLNNFIDEKNEDQSFDQFVKEVNTFMNASLDFEQSLEPVKMRYCSPFVNKRKTKKKARSISKKLSKINLDLKAELGRNL